MFNPGVSTQTVTLTTLSDALSEGDEDLTAGIAVAADSGIGVFAPEASVIITEPRMCASAHTSINVHTCIALCMIEFPFVSDLIRIMFKTENVEVVENRGLAEVCLMLSNSTSTALNVNVTSIASGSATGEN